MKRTKLLRATAIAVLGLSLGAGVASAAPGTATIDTTGPDSYNKVAFYGDDEWNVDNNNDVHVDSNNAQSAYSGDAVVSENTDGGDASTGAASNDNSLSATLSVDNSSSSAAALAGVGGGTNSGDISNTGPDSTNEITFNNDSTVNVSNDNCITVSSNNAQTATSGDATVDNNTTGGSATTGDATNTNATEVSVSITN